MTSLGCDDELEVLDRCKRELQRQLAALLSQQDANTPITFDERHQALLRQLHEIDHHRVDLYLDEQGMHRMEGGE